MALTTTTLGQVKMLEMIFNDVAPGDFKLHLYISDKTPAKSDTILDYTEMSTQGYTVQTLSRVNWVVSTIGSIVKAMYPQVIYTFDGTGGATTVYGYFVSTNDGIEKLVWAERFPNPITVQNLNQQIKVALNIEFE